VRKIVIPWASALAPGLFLPTNHHKAFQGILNFPGRIQAPAKISREDDSNFYIDKIFLEKGAKFALM